MPPKANLFYASVVLLGLNCFLAFKATAQLSYVLDADDGLPENTGQALVQDSLAYIWIGTQNGLVRYDGHNLKVYKESTHGLSSNQIECLLVLDKYHLLIGTRNGLDLLHTLKDSISSYKPDPKENYEANWFNSLAFRGDSIFAASFYGLHILDRQLRPLSFFPSNNQEERTIARLYTGPPPAQKLYYSREEVLYQFNQTYLKTLASFPAAIFSILDQGDSLWLSTREGLYSYHKRGHSTQAISGLPTELSFGLKMAKSRDGRIWVLSTTGLFVYNQGEWDHYHSSLEGEKGLSHSLCLAFLEDHQSQIWIGTGQGINIIDPRRQAFERWSADFKGRDYDWLKNIEALFYDSLSQSLWLGSSEGLFLLQRNEAGKWRQKDPGSPFWDRRVNIDYIGRGHGQELLVGSSEGGFYRCRDGTWEQILKPGPYRQLRAILPASKADAYWLGFADGLYYWNSKQGIHLPKGLSLIPTVQMDYVNRRLWVSSAKGLFRIDTASLAWTLSVSGDLFPNTLITDFWQQGDTVWMSSFGSGLYQYQLGSQELKIFNEDSGLSNNNVWSIYPDTRGHLWLSTDQGISRFRLDSQSFTPFFAQPDGLNFNDFSMVAHTRDEGGRLYFGNPKGLSVFNPLDLSADTCALSPGLSSLLVDYQAAPHLLREAIKTRKIELASTWTNLRLGFSAFNFRKADLQWQFSLNGNPWLNMEEAIFNMGRPEPGTHILRVRNHNEQGIGGPPLELELMVLPAYYETLWFKLLILSLALAISGWSVYLFNRRRIRRLKFQQGLHQERERISRDLHDHVGAHLSRIASDLDILEFQMREKGDEAGIDQIAETRNFTAETIRLLRDTIWAIDKDEYSLQEFSDKIRSFLNQYLADYVEWKLELDLKAEKQLSSRVVLNLLRILQEASQNMLKHSRAQKFEVHLKAPAPLVLEIRDNGIGMGHQQNAEPSYGLVNMKKRAEELGASFWINGKDGFTLRVELPL